MSAQESQPLSPAQSAPTSPLVSEPSGEKAKAESQATISPELLQKNFAEALNQISRCLALKNLVNTGSAKPAEVELLDLLKPDLTDPVIQTEDWQVTTVTLPNGELRKIKLETDYTNDENVTKVLKYFRVETDQSLSLIPLPFEQTQDPSETFIASLEKDGNILSREKANRYYYQSGEELLVTEKNGQILNFEMTRMGRTVKCPDLSLADSQCSCQQ